MNKTEIKNNKFSVSIRYILNVESLEKIQQKINIFYNPKVQIQ